MAYTVWSAFNEFRKDTIDLAPDITDKAITVLEMKMKSK